jgi:hypothetical protein
MLAYRRYQQILKKIPSIPHRAGFLVSSLGLLGYKVYAHYSLFPEATPCEAVSRLGQNQRDSAMLTDPKTYRTLARRPNDALLARMSCLAYTDESVLRRSMDQGVDVAAELEAYEQEYIDELRTAGWRVAESYAGLDCNDQPTGYYGVAFEHPDDRQLVLAHRGTQPKLPGGPQDLFTDFNLVAKQLTLHHADAMAYSLALHEEYVENQRYQMGMTGHSLGGFLAIIGLYTIARYRKPPLGQHAYATTFDTPGPFEFLKDLESTIEGADRVSLGTLDVTNYLSGAVNVVNCCGKHIGCVYSVHDSKFPALSANPLDYLMSSHDKQRLAAGLDLNTGRASENYQLLLMQSWPSINLTPDLSTSGLEFVAQELVNNQSWYQKATKGFKQFCQKLFDKYPSSGSFRNYTGLGYGLAEMTYQLGTSRVDDQSYQTFRDHANSTAGFGDSTSRDPYNLDTSALHDSGAATDAKRQTLLSSLRAQWEPVTLNEQTPDPTQALALRHFPEPFRQVLKDYCQITQTFSRETLQECFQELPFDLLDQAAIDGQYVTISSEQTLQAFRAELIQSAADWPMEYFQGMFSVQLLRHAFSTRNSPLTAVKQFTDYYRLILCKLRAFQTQSRLYLFGIAPAEEIIEHRYQEEELRSLQAVVNNHLQFFHSQANTKDSPEHTGWLVEQLSYQTNLIELAILLNAALLGLKLKEPEKAHQLVKETLALLDDKKFKQQITEHKNQGVDSNEFYAYCFNLLGKSYRQTWVRGDHDSTEKVITAYKKVLDYVDNDVSTLSSLAAFHDDLQRFSEAEDYHSRALRYVESNPKNKGRKAVTYSNYAWNCYHRALAMSSSSEQKTLLGKAATYLEDSLKLRPNAGTYLYLAKVLLATIPMTPSGDADAIYTKVCEQLDSGLTIEPNNLKLLVERAEFINTHYPEDRELALQDAKRVIIKTEHKQHLAEYSGYYDRAMEIIDALTPSPLFR